MTEPGPIETAFNAWCAERPWLMRKEDEENEDTARRQAQLWRAWEAFRDGWQAARAVPPAVVASAPPTQAEIEAIWAEFHVDRGTGDMANECRLAAAILRLRRGP